LSEYWRASWNERARRCERAQPGSDVVGSGGSEMKAIGVCPPMVDVMLGFPKK
jgi:hypothetical protein